MADVQKTSTITGLSRRTVQTMLKDYTHSELREWKFDKSRRFKPAEFMRTLKAKHLAGSKDLLLN